MGNRTKYLREGLGVGGVEGGGGLVLFFSFDPSTEFDSCLATIHWKMNIFLNEDQGMSINPNP